MFSLLALMDIQISSNTNAAHEHIYVFVKGSHVTQADLKLITQPADGLELLTLLPLILGF